MISVAYGQERIKGDKVRGMHLLTSHFQKLFDVHNFFVISNLFDSNKSYVLSTHNRKCEKKCVIFGEALRTRVKKFKQNLRKNYSKSTKIGITACKFSKNFRGSMPPDLSCFSFSFKLILPKKNAWKKSGNYTPSLLKFLATPLLANGKWIWWYRDYCRQKVGIFHALTGAQATKNNKALCR